MKKSILLIFSLFLFSQTLPAQCDPGQVEITILVHTDDYPGETAWVLEDINGNLVAADGPYASADTDYESTVCVPSSNCLIFRITDEFGDGICCGYGEGYYEVRVDGVLTLQGGEFTAYEESNLSCPPGTVCSSAFPVEEGNFTAIPNESVWYTFTPDSTGTYLVSTCDAACNTTIWIYDYCTGLQWNNTIEGTIYFNDDACGAQAEINAVLAAGKTYYIRIGSIDQSCNDQPVDWSVAYNGPVVGCMDPDACNFQPLATVDSGDCIYPGDPNCPDGPDLTVLQDVLQNSLFVDYVLNNDGCLIQEGCINGYGQREVIRFDTWIENIGNLDYYIGVPPANPDQSNEQWEWDLCHNHWHYEGYAEYVLYDENNNELPIGFKNGFCVLDLTCSLGGGIPKYSCGNQGISAGCGDIYGSYLDCQWIDITDLPAGTYMLVVRVNWDQSPDALGHIELDYANNWAQVCFDLTRDPITNAASIELSEECIPFVDCAGEVYGNAVPDCTGECNGVALVGDLNADTLRNNADLQLYIAESLNDTLTLSACTDLNADGLITVTDAALLLECNLHEGQPALPGHSHYPCEFPFNVLNFNDTTEWMPANWDPVNQELEIWIRNPYNNIGAFEFSLTGGMIQEVSILDPDFSVSLFHDNEEILGISFDEDVFPKHQDWVPFLKVKIAPTDSEICINPITAVVNDVREEVIAVAGPCLQLISSAGGASGWDNLQARVIPNPFKGSAVLRIDRTDSAPVDIDILRADGMLVAQYRHFASEALELDASDWAPGVYYFRISGQKGYSIGRFAVE